jgi:hypothetical protein
MVEHQHEVNCACGASWRILLPADDDDLLAVCEACGATTANLVDLGEIHSAGYDVEA